MVNIFKTFKQVPKPAWLSVMTPRGEMGWGLEAHEGGDICIYNYGWFVLLYGRNEHNIVKQSSSS